MAITSLDLTAAILDQKIAGAFSGKRYAYVGVTTDNGGIGLGVAVENERGYNPIHGKTFETMTQADDFCAAMNAHIGITADAAMKLIITTMRPPSAEKPSEIFSRCYHCGAYDDECMCEGGLS